MATRGRSGLTQSQPFILSARLSCREVKGKKRKREEEKAGKLVEPWTEAQDGARGGGIPTLGPTPGSFISPTTAKDMMVMIV